MKIIKYPLSIFVLLLSSWKVSAADESNNQLTALVDLASVRFQVYQDSGLFQQASSQREVRSTLASVRAQLEQTGLDLAMFDHCLLQMETFSRAWAKSGLADPELDSDMQYACDEVTASVLEPQGQQREIALKSLIALLNNYGHMSGGAASTDILSTDTQQSITGLIQDLDRYVRASGSDYLNTRWRYIRLVMSREDYRMPDIVGRHGFSLAKAIAGQPN